jgi:TonB family protein
MKTCSRCGKTYPDSEKFCETDGTALVEGEPAGRPTSLIEEEETPAGEEIPIECPVCGGKAQPGELICNFCGARLAAPEVKAGQPKPEVSPETFVPSRGSVTSEQLGGEAPSAGEQGSSGRRLIARIGYAVAALIALAGGAWLALHLTEPSVPRETAKVATPAASPAAIAGPLVALAENINVQVKGASASDPARNEAAARKVFDDNKPALLDLYKRTLEGDETAHDGMLVRVRVLPDGEVEAASVITSTAPNPGLDGEVVKEVMGWRFAPFTGGQVETDYPIVFAHNSKELAAISSVLSTKIAGLGPGETPEYASVPPPGVPAETASPVPTPAEVVSKPAPPESIAKPKPAAPAVTERRRPRRRPELSALPKPKPSLLDRVQAELRTNRKLNRVKAYTNQSTVTLYGRVYDNGDRLLAERTVRRVNGVKEVINTITTDTATWAAQEAQITQQLQSAGLDKVKVKVIGKDAYLSGEVANNPDRERAVTITEGAVPVKVRTNLIRVAPGNVFGF